MKVLSTCSNENGLIFLAEFKRCGRHNIRGSGSSLTYSVETSFGEWPHMCSLFQVHFEGLVTHIRLDMMGKLHRKDGSVLLVVWIQPQNVDWQRIHLGT